MINVEEFVNYLRDINIDFFTGVPDSQLSSFADYVEENCNNIIAANEGNALAIGVDYKSKIFKEGEFQPDKNSTDSIDYKELQSRCAELTEIFKGAVSVRVTAPAGTDLIVPINGRSLLSDDGDFSKPGSGGNIPAGEVFISPGVGGSQLKNADGTPIEQQSDGCEGLIVYDGSMTFSDGDSILETPITCKVSGGYVTDISGGAEARRLLKTILEAEVRPFVLEKEGKLPQGQAAIYKKNARNIGELGIGLNPAANITGNMLEDEKAFHTCHFAIGENYDNDAPSLIHLDGVVRNPTITLTYADGTSRTILQEGALQI